MATAFSLQVAGANTTVFQLRLRDSQTNTAKFALAADRCQYILRHERNQNFSGSILKLVSAITVVLKYQNLAADRAEYSDRTTKSTFLSVKSQFVSLFRTIIHLSAISNALHQQNKRHWQLMGWMGVHARNQARVTVCGTVEWDHWSAHHPHKMVQLER